MLILVCCKHWILMGRLLRSNLWEVYVNIFLCEGILLDVSATIFTCRILSFLNESINKSSLISHRWCCGKKNFSSLEKVNWKWLTRLPLDSNNKVNKRNFNWVPRISCNSHFLHFTIQEFEYKGTVKNNIQ